MTALELLQLIAAAATATKELVDVAQDLHASGATILSPAQYKAVTAIAAGTPWRLPDVAAVVGPLIPPFLTGK